LPEAMIDSMGMGVWRKTKRCKINKDKKQEKEV
jgi:hypothetical protein